jgi:hypothetical protein
MVRGRPFAAVARPLRLPAGRCSVFRMCHLSCIPWIPSGSYHIRPHSSDPCLVFMNFLRLSNRRFPYLGLVGIFAAQNIHSGFLFQFVRQVTSVGIPYMRVPQEGMCDDVTTTLNFLAHIVFRVKSLVRVITQTLPLQYDRDRDNLAITSAIWQDSSRQRLEQILPAVVEIFSEAVRLQNYS